MRYFLSFLLLLLISACGSTSFKEVYKGFSAKGYHARGISSQDSILIISGAKGKISVFDLNVLAVTDSFSLPASDFRGVKYSQKNTLLLMNSGETGIVYRYHLKNKTIDTVLHEPGAFYDAISISENGAGFLMGDPIDEKFTVYKTIDFGKNWTKLINLPVPLKGEAGFAASNTGIAQFNNTVLIGTGASNTSRILKSQNGGETWSAINTPMKSGGSYGIYSMAFWSAQKGAIAGGSYQDKEFKDSICFITTNGGKTWKNRSEGLPGYISCITSSEDGSLLVATGRLGAYYSANKGKSWSLLTKQPFYTASIVKRYICLTGKNGTLAIFLKQQ